MAQPIKNRGDKKIVAKKPKKKSLNTNEIIKRNIERSKKSHPQYGTSKLEDKFAKEFLDKLGVQYERQFEAKEIKRFYDFKIGNRLLIEVDGDYW